jgi:ATP-dependent Clp protease ATP-binding subunit ClpC
MDEAGARSQIKTEIPETIKKLQDAIERLRIDKEVVIKDQDFEKAAEIRDTQTEIQNQLDIAKNKWRNENRHNKIQVDEIKIREVVSMMTGVPVEKCDVNDAKKYLDLEKIMKEKIVDQDEALTAVAKTLRRNKTSISNPNKPIGTFLFLGGTGVGKTETAKTIADEIFGPNSLIRIDMSEYQERHTVSKLIGAPPGYVGYGEGGDLTEKVRRKPFCVVLFDEIEKAHPDVFNTLLQVLDEGFLSDRQGRKVNFRNTIIIMTSNVGVKQAIEMGNGVGFRTETSETKQDAMKYRIDKELRHKFAPEFLNRIQEIITFNSLSEDAIKNIIKLHLNKLGDRIRMAGYDFKWNKNVVDYIFNDSYEPEYGARPVERAIQRLIEDDISEEMLKTDVQDGSTISISYLESKNELKVVIKK